MKLEGIEMEVKPAAREQSATEQKLFNPPLTFS